MKLEYTISKLFFGKLKIKEADEILYKWNFYYRNLSEENKEIFILRVLIFRFKSSFSAEPSFDLTSEVELLISSAFIQITFGLNRYTLSTYNSIFVAPRAYAYRHIGELYNGDVNTVTKTINLAWPAVKEGFNDPNDAMNLVLHEFGHSILIENHERSSNKEFFSNHDWLNWNKEALLKLEIIKKRENKVLRDYGGENIMELFSVALETFFERPDFFYDNAQSLYISLSKLLRQDPRKKYEPVIQPR